MADTDYCAVTGAGDDGGGGDEDYWTIDAESDCYCWPDGWNDVHFHGSICLLLKRMSLYWSYSHSLVEAAGALELNVKAAAAVTTSF
uniref:Uncharacterized protein n=1 Tax=Bracon brevicornis TaxID=1563983 RepID=A0A6V7JMB5_9HYME